MLDLNEKLKARLIATLGEVLPSVEVLHGKFLTSRNRVALIKLDEALPGHGPLRERLARYIDADFPAMTFIFDLLQYELAIEEYTDDSKKLSEIVGFEDATANATRLINAFDSLPWRYALSIALPKDVSDLLGSVVVDESLGPNLRLVKATKDFSGKYPLNHTDKKRHESIHRPSLLFGPEEESYIENAVYLQIDTEGFIGPYGGSSPAIQAERVLKSFLGLALALRLVKVANVVHGSPPTRSFFVHKNEGDAWTIHAKIDLDRDPSRLLAEIEPNEMFSSASEERKVALVKLILDELKAVFSAGEKAETILLGAEWLFESYGVQDRRLSYVQSMVVLEVLLGDKATSDVIGLGQLLRNRCAYLIGKTHDERRTLLKEFDEIYAVRSQIVHRGKANLNFKERLLSGKLRDICNRVIQREVDLLRGK
ncbi:HEPN domain-containing protein [Bradyrhizobium sp. NBAIM08]|uniref:HEPN domain-containing protein n=1 Tax=Bradyrhizobium sp. NBAIM08 TaxID=2793815 RepID=UPI001CD6E181|nr:HEPN domain-containing protein [Bradyrhizobium sp. NBAIM08]MCA1475258.1 hypothetical protein [Bradyrhizobium sp. NBAIM08]